MSEETTPPRDTTDLERLLEYLKQSRGFDLGAYKDSSLERRMQKRMDTLGIKSYAEYLDHLEVHPDEFGLLFNTILINVTSFFRDEGPWKFMRERLIPELLKRKPEGDVIRVWSAGCASGEEAYSIAICFAEALGMKQFVDRVKIYATDVSDAALHKARLATYSERELEPVPAELRAKYFTQVNGGYMVILELRRAVVFGRHDLIKDSPISRVDLLLCRNTLMYFNREAQDSVLQRFHFGLAPHGHLVLGKAEMLLSSGHMFVPVDLKQRVLRKSDRWVGIDRPWLPLGKTTLRAPEVRSSHASRDMGEMREVAITSAQAAQLLIDPQGRLASANDEARKLFELGPGDIGRPISELPPYFRPVDLRNPLREAGDSGKAQVLPETVWPAGEDGSPRFFEVSITPLRDRDDRPLGSSVIYTNITSYLELEGEFRRMNQALETAQEELQTTNEELQSTVEELETTNEELHSTNEELETMNEELQSTNEELRTSNDELRQRSEELDRIHTFWRSIISAVPAGIAVLDRELRVLVWNAQAEELWGVRADEVGGKNFLNLDIGLPVQNLRDPVRDCIAGKGRQEITLDAVNRRGRMIRCRVDINQLDASMEGDVLLMMHEVTG